MLLIGLTGPSGAGKSTAGELFASFDLPILDADRIYHDLLIPPSECLSELVSHFGREILTPAGLLDRRALAEIVFGDAAELEQLNRISHRHVLREIRRRLRQMQAAGVRAAVLDAPQLFESGLDRSCSAVVSVLADTELRLHRILLRDSITPEEAMRRIQAQKSDSFFRAHSDYILENNGNREQMLPQIKAILSETGVLTP